MPLYDCKILDELDFDKFNLKLPAGCTYLNPSPSLVLRPLQRDDFDKGTQNEILTIFWALFYYCLIKCMHMIN